MKPASFFRVEGTIIARSPVPDAAWFALHQDSLDKRLSRLGGVLAARLSAAVHPLGDGPEAERLAWSNLRGLSVDRLHFLAEEFRRTQLQPRVLPAGRRLVQDARARGHLVVFITSIPALIVEPLLRQLGADRVIASALEIRDGEVTGRLGEPCVTRLDGAWARAFAAAHAIDLSTSEAFGSRGSDALLMSLAGQPAAVQPDWRLRRIAEEHGWPIIAG
jgi:phosphoserine phosphatase